MFKTVPFSALSISESKIKNSISREGSYIYIHMFTFHICVILYISSSKLILKIKIAVKVHKGSRAS